MLPFGHNNAQGQATSNAHPPSLNNMAQLCPFACDADQRMGVLNSLFNTYPPPWNLFREVPPQIDEHFKNMAAGMRYGLRLEYEQYVLLWQMCAWVGHMCPDQYGGGLNGETNFIKNLIRLAIICMPAWITEFPDLAHLAFGLMLRPETQPNMARDSGRVGDCLFYPRVASSFENNWSFYNNQNNLMGGCVVIEVTMLGSLTTNETIGTYGGLLWRQKKEERENFVTRVLFTKLQLFVPKKQIPTGEELRVYTQIEASVVCLWAYNMAGVSNNGRDGILYYSAGRNYQPDPNAPDVWENVDNPAWELGFQETAFPPVGSPARYLRAMIDERWAEFCTRRDLAEAKAAFEAVVALDAGALFTAPPTVVPGCSDSLPAQHDIRTLDPNECDNYGHQKCAYICYGPPLHDTEE